MKQRRSITIEYEVDREYVDFDWWYVLEGSRPHARVLNVTNDVRLEDD